MGDVRHRCRDERQVPRDVGGALELRVPRERADAYVISVTLIPASAAMRLMSTRTFGAATRKFSIGTRLWPPASTRASSLCFSSSASASATLAGRA